MTEHAWVRRATPGDAIEVARLRWRFRSEEEPEHAETWESFAGWALPFFRSALSGERWATFVAEADGRLVGCACVEVVDVVPRPARPDERAWGYLTNVYVEPDHRGAGLGEELVSAATRWSEEAGLETVLVWPSGLSVTLYERAGFAPPATLLERPGTHGG